MAKKNKPAVSDPLTKAKTPQLKVNKNMVHPNQLYQQGTPEYARALTQWQANQDKVAGNRLARIEAKRPGTYNNGNSAVYIPGAQNTPGPSLGNPGPSAGPGGQPPAAGSPNDALTPPGQYTPGGMNPNFMPTPGNNAPGFTTQGAEDDLHSILNQATGGTINAFNTAANRLRERLDSAGAGQADAATNKNLGRGFGNSGLNDADQFRVQQNTQDAYAQGLGNLETQFEQQRQQGLQTALGAANSIQGGRQFMDNQLYGLLNSREGRGSNEYIAGLNAQYGASEGAANRDLQRRLAELEQQNNNWRTAFNGAGQFNGGGGGYNQAPAGGGGGRMSAAMSAGPSLYNSVNRGY